MAAVAERIAKLANWEWEDVDSLWEAVETAGVHYRVGWGARDEVYLEFGDRSAIVIFPDGGWTLENLGKKR